MLPCVMADHMPGFLTAVLQERAEQVRQGVTQQDAAMRMSQSTFTPSPHAHLIGERAKHGAFAFVGGDPVCEISAIVYHSVPLVFLWFQIMCRTLGVAG